MTATTGSDAGGAAPAAPPAPERPARPAKRRTRTSLALRIALVTSLLVLLAVGASVAVTAWLGGRIAARAAADQLDLSREVQRAFRDQRYQRLWLSSDLFALDPYLAAYVAEAAESADTASILDLLGQNQQQLGFDFAAVLTPEGRVLAHTERPDAPGEDLSGRPLVAKALEEYEASGVWAEGDRLYDAVVVPVARGLDLGGYLLVGFRIDDELARGVREASRAEVAYFVRGEDGYRPVGATLDEAAERELTAALRARAGEVAPLMSGDGDEGGRLTLDLGGRPWLALLAPLRDVAGAPVGVAATLSSLDEQLATYRRLQWLLTATGAVAILLAVGLAYPLSRRSLRPVRELAEAAEAARRGDYDRRVGDAGGDEVGRLAATFDELLSSLREKRDMETYMSHLSLSLPEAAEPAGGAQPAPPAAEEVVLVAAELRRHGRSVGATGPGAEAAMAAFQRDLDRLTAAALGEGGRLEAVLGHRVLVSFAGASAAERALAVAVAAMAAARGESGETWALPVVALAAGTAARGGVRWGEGARPAVVGLPAARIESLLRDASPGEVVFAPDVARSLEGVLGERGLAARAQTGLVSSQKIHALPADELERLGDLSGAARTVSLPEEPAPLPLGPDAPGAASADGRLGVGSVLGGRFEIVSVLGSGGMGVVYKARDRELSEMIALKVLRSDTLDSGENRERLKEELRLARRITHPNVLRTYDFGDLDGVTFVSMEYVRGVTLRALLEGASEPLPFRAALRLARQVSAGLAAAHELGVVHRDVKPENVILDPAGNARVMDFGIARTVAEESAYTRAGQVVGTPHYIAPERLRSEPADARSDVYSLGVMLFEVFAGEPPFPGGTLPQIVSQHLYDPPPPVRSRRADIPEDLEAILLRCLAKAPEARFADAGALLAALDRVHG